MHRLTRLLAVLFAPLASAWQQEFGGVVDEESDSLPEPPPSADPMVVKGVPRGAATHNEPTPTPNDDAMNPSAVVEPELFVRRGSKAYRPARPTDSGPHYRREVVGKKRIYSPVEARR